MIAITFEGRLCIMSRRAGNILPLHDLLHEEDAEQYG